MLIDEATEGSVEDVNLDDFEKILFNPSADDANNSDGDNKDDSPAIEETEVEPEVKEEPESKDSEDDDDLAEEDEEPKLIPKKKKSAQERIDEITAKLRQTERELETERQRKAKAEEPAPKETPKDDARPSPDAKNEDGTEKYPLGEFDPQYINDLTRHSLEQNMKALDEKRQQQEEQKKAEEFRTELLGNWQTKVNEVEKEYPDFKDSTSKLGQTFENLDPSYSEYLGATIMSMDKGAEVLYYLSQHPDEAQSIVASGPTWATIALGELHAQFKSKGGNKALKVTSAPEPPPSNKGRSVTKEVPDDTDDLEAFERKLFKKK